MDFDKDEYCGDYLIPLLQDDELSKPGSELVEMLKRGPRVAKKSIKEKYGTGKDAVTKATSQVSSSIQRISESEVAHPVVLAHIQPLTHIAPASFNG